MPKTLIKPVLVGVATLAAWEFVVRPAMNKILNKEA